MAIREITAYLIAPVLIVTGFRFSKAYRHGFSRFHQVVYACVNTVSANYIAGLPPMGG